jgi:hypothetical protein
MADEHARRSHRLSAACTDEGNAKTHHYSCEAYAASRFRWRHDGDPFVYLRLFVSPSEDRREAVELRGNADAMTFIDVFGSVVIGAVVNGLERSWLIRIYRECAVHVSPVDRILFCPMVSGPTIETHSKFVERDTERKIRHRNKLYYRLNHWPIWIFVFFIAPGPMVFDLFERGFDQRMVAWLAVVLVGTAIAGLSGQLPGCEPRPYIIRFTEDRPNPLYRRVCYTTAWGEVVAFALLNIAGLAYAFATGEWRLRQMYEYAYFPIAGTMWCLGALGLLPRVKSSTKGEGHERRYFYGSVWAVACAQPVLWFLWKVLPHSRLADGIKLLAFVGILVVVGNMARRGQLPRTRPIVPGEWAVSD